MRPEPVFTPGAHDDVFAAAAYYAAHDPRLGLAFLDEVERAASLIYEAPLLSTMVEPPVRRQLLRRFPYGVFFTAGSATDPDVILAVVDLRQDPDVVRRAYLR
ncbi:MAG: type II toxin-antitoxin system RelE/ParE family toxin [Polyangiaceae bacterium]|nr:type II toxin-antitoxin system RelE/ParE family toxin [Polyangiaceae bacterium]